MQIGLLQILLAQAEHDTNSQCILISKDKNFIKKVKKSLMNQLKSLPRKLIAKKSLKFKWNFNLCSI